MDGRKLPVYLQEPPKPNHTILAWTRMYTIQLASLSPLSFADSRSSKHVCHLQSRRHKSTRAEKQENCHVLFRWLATDSRNEFARLYNCIHVFNETISVFRGSYRVDLFSDNWASMFWRTEFVVQSRSRIFRNFGKNFSNPSTLRRGWNVHNPGKKDEKVVLYSRKWCEKPSDYKRLNCVVTTCLIRPFLL